MPPMDKLLADGTQQVSLPAAGIAERENVLVAVDERVWYCKVAVETRDRRMTTMETYLKR